MPLKFFFIKWKVCQTNNNSKEINPSTTFEDDFNEDIDKSLLYYCESYEKGTGESAKGTGIYSYYSGICNAAAHMGYLNPANGGYVVV